MSNLEVLDDISEIVHYNRSNVPLYIVKSDLKHFSNKSALCHWHDDIEIMYIVKGHISYNVNGEIFSLSDGDAVVVNSRQLHYGFSQDGSDCIYYCYVFKPELFFHNDSLYEQYLNPIISSGIPYTLFHKDEPACDEILQILPRIYLLESEQPLGYELKIISLLQQFWSIWYSFVYPLLASTVNPADANIQIQKRMVLYIRKHYQEKLQISDIARAGNISRTKCCQVFRKYFHSSPIEYLNACRLEESCKLLINSQIPITEIALSCGFSSSSYFAEFFHKQKGCSPKEYRKRSICKHIKHTR